MNLHQILSPLSLFSISILFCQAPLPSGTYAPMAPGQPHRIVDLTHDFSKETVYWVTAREFELDTVFAGDTEKGYYYSANNFASAEHGGTHIDAPIHFQKGNSPWMKSHWSG